MAQTVRANRHKVTPADDSQEIRKDIQANEAVLLTGKLSRMAMDPHPAPALGWLGDLNVRCAGPVTGDLCHPD